MKDKGLGNTGHTTKVNPTFGPRRPPSPSLSRRLQPRNAGFRTARHRNTSRLRAKARGIRPNNNNISPTLAGQPCKASSGSNDLQSAVVSVM